MAQITPSSNEDGVQTLPSILGDQSSQAPQCEIPVSQPENIKTKAVGSSFLFEVCETSSTLSKVDPSAQHDSKEETTSSLKSIWEVKWNRSGPILGLFALLMGVLSVPIAFAILRASDRKAVDSWKFSPSVYLAIMTSITGKALSLAALQGAVICWWMRAIRGSTMAQLHRDWQMGQNIWDALIAGRRINIIAIACICAAIAAIDAPLLQRASSVVPTVPNSPTKLNVSLISEIPGAYTGTGAYPYSNATRENIAFNINTDFMPIVKKWLKKEPIPPIVKNCPGLCSTTIRAPMLEVWNCTRKTQHIDHTAPLPGNETYLDFINSRELQMGSAIFRALSTLDPSGWPNIEREFIALTTQMTDSQFGEKCVGSIETRDCLLAQAIGEYDVIVQDNETSYLEKSPKPRFSSWANNTSFQSQIFKSESPANITKRCVCNLLNDEICRCSSKDPNDCFCTVNTALAGIANAFNFKYSKLVSMFIRTDGTRITWNLDDWSVTYIKDLPVRVFQDERCALEWDDPFEDILADMNDLMFRAAVHVSRPDFRDNLTTSLLLDPGVLESVDHETNGLYISQINVFSVDYIFFWTASMVEIICIGVIIYTFYGWWQLGRAVSFSPLELAKAFQSPMFSGINSNNEADDIAKDFGERKVRYGIVGIEADRLAFTDTNRVQKPISGAVLSR